MTADRETLVVRLLTTIADWEPSPPAATPRGAQPGEVGVLKIPCEPCEGTGRLRGRSLCRTCKGRGTVAHDPQTGQQAPEARDPHDFELDQRDLALSVRWRRVRCDRCGGMPSRERGCDRCAGSGRVDVPDTRREDAAMRRTQRDWLNPGTASPDWWLPAALERKQALFRTGSYPELERLLDQLEYRYPVAHRLVDRVYVHPLDRLQLTARAQARVGAVVVWLADRMPTTIRVPDRDERAWKRALQHGHLPQHTAARQARDQEIRARVMAGQPVGEVAASFGLSRQWVHQLVGPVATVAA